MIPNTEYCVTVYNIGSIRICTSPARHRIYVTEEPYNAVGDGKTLNTAALQQAFTDCGPNDEVYFPAGIYLTGALDLHSCMAVYLEKDAVLQGSSDPTDYLPRIWSRFEGTEQECYRSLLNAGHLDHTAGANCENILLYGKGTISGGGHVLAERMIDIERENLREYLAQNAALVATCENDRTIPGRVRGRLINLSNCSRIRITGLTLQNGAAWNVHMIYCDDIVTDHCTLRSGGIWNGDGWDPDSSTNCTLFATEFETEDDSVAIKSGKNPEGNAINRPTKHICVFDCHSNGGHGICIGSEMSGGVRNVYVADCTLIGTDVGLRFKSTRGRGGVVENVYVDNINMINIPGDALIADLYYAVKDAPGAPVPAVTEETPSFKNIHISNISCKGAGRAMFLNGLPEMPIENFSVRNMRITDAQKGAFINKVASVTLENIEIETADNTYLQVENTTNITIDGKEYDTISEKRLLTQN